MARTHEEACTALVVASNDDARQGAVCEALHRLGWDTGQGPVPPETLYEADPNVLLVLVPPDQTRDQELIRLLDRFPLMPGLVLFPCDATAWDVSLINRCNDFVGWPCSDKELRYRLDRVSMKAGGAAGESYLDPGDELVNLNIVGVSEPLRRAVRHIHKLSRCDAPVLVNGETGTGKELAARGIHYNSSRRDGPFVAVNCGALPDHLSENELFGHERGAYTDAAGQQAGMVAEAVGGTLFLDEIQALSPHVQATLLRFLEDGSYRPLGASRSHTADVRVIAACNADLAALAGEGRFRSDLLYRLDVLSLNLPPLRERRDDVAVLAEHFLRLFRIKYEQPDKYLAAGTLPMLQRYRWPGNIRELENRLHRAFVLTEQLAITPADVLGDLASEPPRPRSMVDANFSGSFQQEKAAAVAEFERRYLQWVYTEADGNVSAAARQAGKERRALGKLLKKHGIGWS